MYVAGSFVTTTSDQLFVVSQLTPFLSSFFFSCLHPFLFPGAEPNVGLTTVKDLIGASGKLAVLDALLRSLFLKGHRVVLFSQFVTVLDILQDYCTMRGWKFCAFDGRSPRARRNYFVQQFNAPDSPYFIFLMSTRSGGMGINLQSADTCILFDSDWNPQQDLQAMARVHRYVKSKHAIISQKIFECGFESLFELLTFAYFLNLSGSVKRKLYTSIGWLVQELSRSE